MAGSNRKNFDSYLLPTMKDIPPMTIIGVENPDIAGPLGAKGIGEPATELAAAAINNAVSFALETRFNKLPLTLEQVILGYNLKKPVRQKRNDAGGGKTRSRCCASLTWK